MFQHITVLFSFVFAIALTHVLSCVSKLILARDRVRFSGLHALWMLNALMLLLINWLSLWLLQNIKHWSVDEIMVQLGGPFRNSLPARSSPCRSATGKSSICGRFMNDSGRPS